MVKYVKNDQFYVYLNRVKIIIDEYFLKSFDKIINKYMFVIGGRELYEQSNIQRK